jgi:hypothetical protein
MKDRQQSLSWENLKKSCDMICNYEKPAKIDNEVVRSSSSSDSWTFDLVSL